MMVKVSAYRLKYILLQIYNFHLEEAAFLNKITGTPNSSKGGFPYSSNKKMYQIPRPHDSVPMIHELPKRIQRFVMIIGDLMITSAKPIGITGTESP